MKWVALGLGVIAVGAGCRDSAYATVSKTDTIEAYRRFILENPKDENVEAANARLAELELVEARRVHTVVAYKRYLEQYPDSERARTARTLLEGLRFNAAQARDAALTWRQFIKDHPDGAHRAEAEAALARVELRDLSTFERSELARLATGRRDDEAGQRAGAQLDETVFASAATAAALYGYLRDFPAGTHRDEVKARLLSLQLEGLLVSGRVAEAKALAQKAPLSAKLPQLAARLKRADEIDTLSRSKDAAVQRALPQYYLRSLDDLVRSIHAPDPMDRWEAAEELGHHVDVKAIDPLLEALRSARQPLVRQAAFDALGKVLGALPKEVAEYEVATRIESTAPTATDAQVVLTLAALLDLSGNLGRAATEYQKAFEPSAPDPVVLRRWMAIRAERKEPYSSAVAARQLSIWAEGQLKELAAAPDASTLSTARALCAAREYALWAREGISTALKSQVEFADDVRVFGLRAAETVRLCEARLRDVELKLLAADSKAKLCGDPTFRSRLVEAEQKRLEALQQVSSKAPKAAPMLLELARSRDPSPTIRTALAPK